MGHGRSACERRWLLPTAKALRAESQGEVPLPAPLTRTRQRLRLDGQRPLEAALLQDVEDAAAEAALRGGRAAERGASQAWLAAEGAAQVLSIRSPSARTTAQPSPIPCPPCPPFLDPAPGASS